jgi:predicted ATP-binding protein involved in virulence
MRLQSIRLENIKCFEDQEIIFTHDQRNSARAKPYRWITLLGENGVGKSTVLQSLGLLLAGPDAAKELVPRPTGWVSDSSKPGKLTIKINQEEGDQGSYSGEQRTRTNFSFTYFVTGDKEVKVPVRGEEEIYKEPTLISKVSRNLSWLRMHAFAPDSKGWFAVGYGSFRRLTRESRIRIPSSMEMPTRATNFSTQFDDDQALSSFESWIVYLDYRLAKNPHDERAKKMRSVGEKAINSLLPEGNQIDRVTSEGLIIFKVQEREVPTMSLSDGFRSVIALAGDLVWRLLQIFPDMENPMDAPGVVLIDELDIHLHPIWQRNIAGWLCKTFPNLQFIVATHSPLITIGAEKDALTVRFQRDKAGVIGIEYLEDLSTYDVDSVLRSPAFGLISTYSPQTQAKIAEYHQLQMRSPKLNPKEKKLLDELKKFVKRLEGSGKPPEPGSLEERMKAFLAENLPT